MFRDDNWFVRVTLRRVFQVALLRVLHVLTVFCFSVSDMEVFASDIFVGDDRYGLYSFGFYMVV